MGARFSIVSIFASMVFAQFAWAGLGNPADGGEYSGIGYISGWKCEANGALTARINGGNAIPLAYRNERPDTRSACGDTNNGFISIVNWAEYGTGTHTVEVFDNGVSFGRHTFYVATLGEPFVRGAADVAFILTDWPFDGDETRIAWNTATQHFEVIEYTAGDGGTPPPPPPPPSSEEQHFQAMIGTWDFTIRFTDGESLTRPYSIHEVRTLSNGTVVAIGTDPLDDSEFLVLSHPGDEYDFGIVDVEALSSGERFCSFYHFHQSDRQMNGIFAWTERQGTQPDVRSCLSSRIIASGSFTGRRR